RPDAAGRNAGPRSTRTTPPVAIWPPGRHYGGRAGSGPARGGGMIDKRVATIAEAMAGVPDGGTVLIGGFGAVGQPNALIDGLIEQGATDLPVVCNTAGVGHVGLAKLMELGRVRKIVCSF